MTTSEHIEEPFARTSTALAMAMCVISTFGWNVLVGHGPRLSLALLGIVILFVSTVGWIWAERRGPRALTVWLMLLLVLTLAALWISYLGVFLMAMPLIGFGVMYGSLQRGLAVTLVLFAFAVVFNLHAGASPIDVYAHSTGFLPGAVFVIVSALLVVRERESRQQVRRYAAQVEELATTRERIRIARDIHDSVGHYLTVVHVQIEAARATVATDPTASSECLVRAQDFARDGLQELRRSVSMLRAGAVDQRPFGVALATLVEECRGNGLDTALTVIGQPRPLPPAIEFTLFRAAQEALTNVARHATATHARCTLRYDARAVSLEVADDGVGAIATDGGFGLLGLRERAALVGGNVQIQTSAGTGFAVEVRVPT
ncbi:MAG: sensor histidine kinase [Deltaproteobacteria bacterium]|nr:sensor histidine kinase [Deltaproteobacteria bacterium]